jgi:hypothetical protein
MVGTVTHFQFATAILLLRFNESPRSTTESNRSRGRAERICAQTVSSEVLHENVALLFDAPNEAVAPFFLTVVNCLDILNSLGMLPALICKAALVQRGG